MAGKGVGVRAAAAALAVGVLLALSACSSGDGSTTIADCLSGFHNPSGRTDTCVPDSTTTSSTTETTTSTLPTGAVIISPTQMGVHPGTSCSLVGAHGLTDANTPMVCSSTSADGATYDQPRWRSG